MLKRTKLYLLLNAMLGGPTRPDSTKASTHHRAKHEDIYREDTVPFLGDVEKYLSRESTALVVGCDDNGVEVAWIGNRCKSTMGISIDEEQVRKSKKLLQDHSRVDFVVVPDASLPFRDESFDVIFMHNVCEHIINLESCFREYWRVLKKNGVLINKFSPLFYSPFGAHLSYALRIPWGHLLFGLRTIVEVRNLFYSGTSQADSWEGFSLNRITEGGYVRLVRRIGFKQLSLSSHTARNLPIVGRLPLLKNLFVTSVESVLVKS